MIETTPLEQFLIGKGVEASMDGETWLPGKLIEVIDLFAPYKVELFEPHEIRAFIAIRHPAKAQAERGRNDDNALR
jgi:hypothetical protein